MVGQSIEAHLREALKTFMPAATLGVSWPLAGGISATMTAFEVDMPDGSRQRLIARQPNRRRLGLDPDVAAKEYRVLASLKSAGLPVQTPYFLAQPDEEFPEPFIVIEYIEGQPDVDPHDPSAYLERYAEQLAQIHRTDWTKLDLGFLPPQDQGYGPRPGELNQSLREGEIRDALESVSPIARSNPLVLCHGDFWPGNVLWRDGEIAAVIDWEEAKVGEPLADLAICRLDLWWILGEDGAHEFTERYQAWAEIDLSSLPYWDLCASLRPITNIDDWAPSYPQLGRFDITAATLRRDHERFVAQALEKF